MQHNDGLNSLFKAEIESRKIEVVYNTRIESVNKQEKKITTSDKSTFKYDNFFSLIPLRANPLVASAQLSDESSLLDVNPKTLQHKKYRNIFGLGDICNLPTQRSQASCETQIQVLQHNLYRALTQQYLNGVYNGFTKVPVSLACHQLTFAKFLYDNKSGFLNLFQPKGPYAQLNHYANQFLQPLFNTLLYRTAFYKGHPGFFWNQSFKEFARVPEEARTPTLSDQFKAIRRPQEKDSKNMA